MDPTQQIRQFITTNFYVPAEADLTDDASLLDRGIIDSTGVMEVIGFLEDTFGVKVQDEELVPENLDSIGRIAAFVARKREGG
jgi:acyl carrier protein